MSAALITGASVATVALVVWGVMLRLLLRSRSEVATLRAEIKDYDNANRELAKALAHALKPPATHDDAVRVLDHFTERSLSLVVSDTDT